ncbi:MAG TPA: hypothetical protein V6D08_09405 [Candidatus Obscuribacterales bacterium]
MQAVTRVKRSFALYQRQRKRGHVMAEFAPALFVLLFGVMLPLLDLAFVPIRYTAAYAMVRNQDQELALSRTAGDAHQALQLDGQWKARLAGCGAKVKKSELVMVVTDRSGGRHAFSLGQRGYIPSELLPDGENAPCVYRLQLRVELGIAPLLSMSGKGVPGLTSPMPVTIVTSAAWENLGRDPETKEFYLNE